ncbi:hypothetical protein HRbin15_01896 [bacterium HR15]|nr:hypothetical protein HRbin15_01896 [bacterium HR15]
MRWLAGLRCGRVRTLRWRYLDNTLSASERARVDRHLARCLSCRAEFARAAFVLESLQKGLPLEAAWLPSSPRRRWLLAIGLIALLGLMGGIGTVRLSRFSPPAISHPVSIDSDQAKTDPHPTTLDRDSTPKDRDSTPTPRPPTTMDGNQKLANRRPPTISKRSTVKPSKRLPRYRAGSSAPSSKSLMPEGVIEVYDESGQLVKREQMRGRR